MSITSKILGIALGAMMLTGCIKYENLPQGESNQTNVDIRVYRGDGVSASPSLTFQWKLLDSASADTCDSLVGLSPELTLEGLGSHVIQDISSFAEGQVKLCVRHYPAGGAAENVGTVEVKSWVKDTLVPVPFNIVSVVDDTPLSDIKVWRVTWTDAPNAVKYRLKMTDSASCADTPKTTVQEGLTGTSGRMAPHWQEAQRVCLYAIDPAGNETAAANNGTLFPHAPYNSTIIFATSFTTTLSQNPNYSGPTPSEFLGRDGADWTCNYAAHQNGYLPSWDGVSTTEFAAVLSSGDMDFIQLMSNRDVGSGFFSTTNEFLVNPFPQNGFFNPVRVDGAGGRLNALDRILTGTLSTGQFGGADCSGYSDYSSVGSMADPSVSGLALGGGAQECESPFRLYCVGRRKPAIGPGSFNIVAPVVVPDSSATLLSWEASEFATSYEVNVSTNEKCTDSVYYQPSLAISPLELAVTLAPGTYHVCMKAILSQGLFTYPLNNGLQFVVP